MTSLATVALTGSVILLAAWGVTVLLRRASADLRHRIWLAALCGMLLLLVPFPVPEAARVDVGYVFTSEAVAGTAGYSAPVLPILWGIGTTFFLLRFMIGVVRLGLIRSRKTEVPGVRESAAISTPLTWGVIRPVILLPSYASEWPEEQRAIAIAHERAHIARGDWFWQSFAQVVQAMFWFHPLVWLAVSRLRQEAELAVDDAVLNGGIGAANYAEQLLDVAKHVRAGSPVSAVAMVRRPVLTARVAAILDATRDRTRAGLRSRVAIVVAALCVVPILAAFQARPVQSNPWPPAPVPSPAPRSRAYPIGDGVSAPVAIYTREAEYSEEARRAKLTGTVWLNVEIDEGGIPTNIAVTQRLGLGLEEKAMEAVRAWRFKPGMKDGRPVRVEATLAVSFRLL